MQKKTKAKLRDIARPRPDRNATQDLRGSACRTHSFQKSYLYISVVRMKDEVPDSSNGVGDVPIVLTPCT